MAVGSDFVVKRIDDGAGGGGNTPRTGRYARSERPKQEVRRCGSCGATAVIVCQAWAHSFSGQETGQVTRDCRCQACGASVTLRDPKAISTFKIIAWVLIITIFGFPYLMFRVWRWNRAWDKNPLVPDAPFPRIAHWRGPGNRRCGNCGKVARLASVTRNTRNGIPMGTTCEYACVGCKRAFETESVGGLFVNFLTVALVAGGGWLWFKNTHEWSWQKGVALLLVAAGAWFFLHTCRLILAALQNPRLSGQEAAS
jgi:hypothetical protein